jgi:hypothetical protein
VAEVARVYLEVGRVWTFAVALDWPGWCRRGRGEEAALEELMDYAPRYAVVAGPDFAPDSLEVVDRLGGDATTDFGAPSAVRDWDGGPLDGITAGRLADLLGATWQVFDEVVAVAPPQLRKGPRGGGRDRDAVADHVREAERSYLRKLGVRVAPRTPWPEQRRAGAGVVGTGVSEGAWPLRYGVLRIAWHVTDHAWEIEDRSDC